MTIPEVIQFIGAAVGLLVILSEIIRHLKEWRLGSPELRLLREQINFQNTQVLAVVDKFSTRVEAIARKVGA